MEYRPSDFWHLRLRLLLRLVPSVAVLWISGAGRPAAAAPPVGTDSRPPQAGAYDRAAAAMGLGDWGSAAQANGVVRVFCRVDRNQVMLTLALPPETPRERARAWLGRLADALGWQSVQLAATPQPGALWLRITARNVTRSRSAGRSQMTLDLPLLRRYLAELTSAPVHLMVRAPETQVAAVSPAPTARTRRGFSEFLYYRLGRPGAPAGPALSLLLGTSDRWLAAAGVAALLWGLFPVAALLAARRQVGRNVRMDEREKLAAYRRWQRGILLATLLGANFTLVLLDYGKLGAVLGRSVGVLPMLLFLAPLALVGLTGRVIGVPLERSASPTSRDLPWYRIAISELVVGSLMLAIPAVLVWIELGSGAAPVMTLGPAFYIIAMSMLPLGIALIAVVWGKLLWRRRRAGALRGESEAPVEVQELVRRLGDRLDCPVERVVIGKAGMAGMARAAVMVSGRLALVSKELVQVLAPDQVAGLVVAAVMVQQRNRRENLQFYGLQAAMFAPMLALVPFMLSLTSPSARMGSAAMPLLFLIGPICMVCGTLLNRMMMKRQEDADFRVSEALESPRRLLDALKEVEELQVVAMGADSGAQRNPAFTQRRTRLQQRLGLD